MPAVPSRRRAIVTALSLLAVGVGLLACGDGDGEKVAASKESQGGEPTSSAPPPEQTPAPATADGDAVAAAQAAVEAWGRFTDTGDLAQVLAHFDDDGPQFLRFQESAAALAADPGAPTGMALASPEVTYRSDDGLQRVVTGTVVVSRPGQPDQSLELALVLFRSADGAWRVWTVQGAGARGGGPVPADPKADASSGGGRAVGAR